MTSHLHLNSLLMGLTLIAILGWLWFLHRRYSAHHLPRTTWMLIAPKIIVAFLFFLALFDPTWRADRPPSPNDKILVLVDASSSMDVPDSDTRTREQRAEALFETISKGLRSYSLPDYVLLLVVLVALSVLICVGVLFYRRRWILAMIASVLVFVLPAGCLGVYWFVFPFDWLVKIEKQTFDMDLPASQTGAGIRGTDLGKVLASLSERPDISSYRAVVLLTDGGDEPVVSTRLPGVRLFIAGIGTDPNTWNDVALTDLVAPPSVEEKMSFPVEAEVQAYKRDPQFAQALKALPVTLNEQIGGEWRKIDQKIVDVSENPVRVDFRVKPLEPGAKDKAPDAARPSDHGLRTRQFQLIVAAVPGELSTLNNERTFSVDVRKRSFFVLLYARKLDWDFAMLRRELMRDPNIKITTLFRTKDEKMWLEEDHQEGDEKEHLEGKRQEGDEVLRNGLPTDPKILEKHLRQYKCIILGSFPAKDLDVRQQEALVNYVKDGGSVVFLGGPDSFGRGGYDQPPLAPLMPWHVSRSEREMRVGEFPVTVPPNATDHAAVKSLARTLQKVRSPFIYSVNPVGNAHGGTQSLLDASVGESVMPLIALQRYGKGQTLGIATNTLWRWGRMEGDIQKAYNEFWGDTIRYLSGVYEGNRFLIVNWDRDPPNYRPSETAEATMQIAGRSIQGQLRFTGTVKHGDKTTEIAIEPVAGTDQMFKTKIFFPDRGEYLVHIDAWAGFAPVDAYERTLRVSPTLNEGACLEVNHAFLKNLAGRSGGMYVREKEIDRLMEHLRTNLLTGSEKTDVRLVQEKGIFFLVVLAVLIAEWVVRRRLNLF